MRLLIVEDEDLLRARLVKALTDSGYVVDSASEGKNGLYAARTAAARKRRVSRNAEGASP